jgi:hypothetical protein
VAASKRWLTSRGNKVLPYMKPKYDLLPFGLGLLSKTEHVPSIFHSLHVATLKTHFILHFSLSLRQQDSYKENQDHK